MVYLCIYYCYDEVMENFWVVERDHEEIIKWAESLDGKPAIIDDPEVGGDNIGIRIDCPGDRDEAMLSEGRNVTEDTSWDRFFEVMESKDLAFMHTSEKKPHNPSMAYKFANRSRPYEDNL